MTKQSNNIPQKTENQGVPMPFYAGYSQAYSDDEISLVDLAKILIRNWWVVIVSVLACAALAWVAAPKMPSYDYVSLIASGINEENEPIESNAAVEAQLSNVFLPRVTREFLAENSELDKLGFRVEVDSLRGTDIVRLTSTATYERSDDVEIVHQRLVQEVVDRQTQLIETLRSRIESRIEQLETTMGNQVSEEV